MMGGSCSRAQGHHHSDEGGGDDGGGGGGRYLRRHRRRRRQRERRRGCGRNGVVEGGGPGPGGGRPRSRSFSNAVGRLCGGSQDGSSSSSDEESHLSAKGQTKRAARYSVEMEVPDRSISHLYPPDDNYEPHPTNPSLRCPKSLTELCVNAVCRSLPDLEGGQLPPHLPQDVVDRLVRSLTSHAALNSTTLRALSRCELGSLSLANCRGVSDEWLIPLSSSSLSSDDNNNNMRGRSSSNNDCPGGAYNGDASSPPTQFVVHPPPSGNQHSFLDVGGPSSLMMDLDNQDDLYVGDLSSSSSLQPLPLLQLEEAPTRPEQREDGGAAGDMEDESRSTSSFMSASSRPSSPLLPSVLPPPEFFSLRKWSPPASSATSLWLYPTRGRSSLMDCNERLELPLLPQKPAPQDNTYAPPANNSLCDDDDDVGYNESFLEAAPTSSTSTLALLDLRGSQRLTDRGLLRLSHDPLSSLEVAKLDNCHGITGKGLLAFSRSHRLHTLSLANCRRLTDEAVINVGHLVSLNFLNLGGCRCLTDRSLEALGGMVGLRKLDLSQCDLITDEGLANLHDLADLEELSLGWCRNISDDGLMVLSSQPGRSRSLQTLRLARCNITAAGLEYLTEFERLEELDLNGCVGVNSMVADVLGRLPSLKSLDVSYCPGILQSSWQGKINALKSLELCYSRVRDSHLAHLRHLPALEELNLDSCLVGDWGIAHLVDNEVMPNLTTLDLADTDISDAAVAKIAQGFRKMRHLSLFYCSISNRGLSYLASMKDLEVLNLDSREIGDEGLRYLRGLPLKSLDLFSSRVTDLGCAYLSKIKTLTSLELCGGGVGDLGCAQLATLPKLTSLNLSQNESITNRGAAALATLSNLKALNLSNTSVTSDALRYLGGLTNLQSLALYGCRDMEDGTERLSSLQSELPSLRCLRLNGTSNEDGVIDHGTDEPEDDDDEDEEDEDGVSHEELDEEDESVGSSSEADEDDIMHHQLGDDGDGSSVGSSEGGSMSDFHDAHAHEVESVGTNESGDMDYDI